MTGEAVYGPSDAGKRLTIHECGAHDRRAGARGGSGNAGRTLGSPERAQGSRRAPSASILERYTSLPDDLPADPRWRRRSARADGARASGSGSGRDGPLLRGRPDHEASRQRHPRRASSGRTGPGLQRSRTPISPMAQYVDADGFTVGRQDPAALERTVHRGRADIRPQTAPERASRSSAPSRCSPVGTASASPSPRPRCTRAR